MAILVGIFFVMSLGMFEVSEQVDNDNDEVALENILSFEDCEEAGFPIQESYPRRCALPDGRVYAEEIEVLPVYDNATADMIVVDTPQPGGVTGKEFVVVGKARGGWFFEASFPIEILGADGNVIGGTYATAEGDWMTSEFVNFKSEMIDLPSAYRGPATLVLHKQNASGLPENEASISIPIVVEY